MKLTRNFKFNPALIAIIPMVNVLFLVVVFFAVSARFVLQPGMKVSLPTSVSTLGPQLNSQLVSITAAPVPTIYYRDRKVSVEELGQHLRDPRFKERSERSLIIRADRGTPYEFLVQVINEGLQHGFSVVLATNRNRP